MSDEPRNDTIDDWSFDDDPVVEKVEKESDDELSQLRRTTLQIKERQDRADRQAEIERMQAEFNASASEEARELASVLTDGVADPTRYKRLLDIAAAKAAKIRGEDEKDDEESESALAPPVSSAPPRVNDPYAALAERTRRGDNKAALQEFLHYGGELPVKRNR